VHTLLSFVLTEELMDMYKNGPKSRSIRQVRSAPPGPMIMETMIYVDTGVVTAQGGSTSTVNYVMSIMNVVSD